MLKPTHPNAPPRSSLHPQDLQSADGSIFRVNGKGLARIFVRKSAETARNRVSGNTLLLVSTKNTILGSEEWAMFPSRLLITIRYFILHPKTYSTNESSGTVLVKHHGLHLLHICEGQSAHLWGILRLLQKLLRR